MFVFSFNASSACVINSFNNYDAHHSCNVVGFINASQWSTKKEKKKYCYLERITEERSDPNRRCRSHLKRPTDFFLLFFSKNIVFLFHNASWRLVLFNSEKEFPKDRKILPLVGHKPNGTEPVFNLTSTLFFLMFLLLVHVWESLFTCWDGRI